MDGTTIILSLASLAFVVGCVATAWWLRRRHQEEVDDLLSQETRTSALEKRLMEERLDVRSRAAEKAETELEAAQRELREMSDLRQAAAAKAVHLGTENSQLAAQLTKANEDLATVRADAGLARVQLAEIRTRLAEAEKGFREKEALFKESGEALKKEFQLLANQIFEQHGQKLHTANTEQLTNVLRPFKDQITDFKRKVEEVYTTDAKDRASLLTEVRNLQEASERVNREAESLTRALKGDTRVQGNWGEVVLERVLTDSGLRRDHEYVVQASFRNEGGDLKRPDVIIHLPGDKDVVIDAKVSLAAYEQALALGDEAAREEAVTRHVQSLRNHVRNLGSQDYDRLEGVRSLDFVLLFIPVEGGVHDGHGTRSGDLRGSLRKTPRDRQPDHADDDPAHHRQRLALREAEPQRTGDRPTRRGALRQGAGHPRGHGPTRQKPGDGQTILRFGLCAAGLGQGQPGPSGRAVP